MNFCREITAVSDKTFHDTELLLKVYRDAVWSLELTAEQVRHGFMQNGISRAEDLCEAVSNSDIIGVNTTLTEHTRCIEKSRKMIALLESSVEMLRRRHKDGELYYWLLYYSYLSPRRYPNADEIMEQMATVIPRISSRTFYRKRKEAISVLSSILWGYTSQSCITLLNDLFPCAV